MRLFRSTYGQVLLGLGHCLLAHVPSPSSEPWPEVPDDVCVDDVGTSPAMARALRRHLAGA